MRIPTAVLLAAIATGIALQADVLEIREIICCANNFKLKHILAASQLPPVKRGIVQMFVYRQWRPQTRNEAASTDPPFEYYRQLFLSQIGELPGIAFVLQSTEGASAALWDPRSGLYETKRVWGDDLLRLEDGSEIITVDLGRRPFGGEDPNVLQVWICTSGNLEKEAMANITASLRRKLGVDRLQIVAGPAPYLWQSHRFPIMVPAFGARGIMGVREAPRTPFIIYYADELYKTPSVNVR